MNLSSGSNVGLATGLASVVTASGAIIPKVSNSTVSSNVLTNDTDVEGDPFVVVNIQSTSENTAVASSGSTYINGTYGWLKIAADGSYTYTLDETRAATHALTTGQVVNEVFTYTIHQTSPALSSSSDDTGTLTVKITGVTDTMPSTASDDTYKISHIDFQAYDAGAGTDTLVLDNAFGVLNLDFTNAANNLSTKLQNIEVFDMTAVTDQKVVMNSTNLAALSSTTNALTIKAESGDVIDLVETIGTGASQWHASISGTTATYTYYNASNAATDMILTVQGYQTGMVI